jgi:hypothetical protein
MGKLFPAFSKKAGQVITVFAPDSNRDYPVFASGNSHR